MFSNSKSKKRLSKKSKTPKYQYGGMDWNAAIQQAEMLNNQDQQANVKEATIMMNGKPVRALINAQTGDIVEILDISDQPTQEMQQAGYDIAQRQFGGMSPMVNNTGYTPGTPSYNNPMNIIPSNNITMQNTPFNVLGIGDNGMTKMMKPGGNYSFGGASRVAEIPLKRSRFQLGGGTGFGSTDMGMSPEYMNNIAMSQAHFNPIRMNNWMQQSMFAPQNVAQPQNPQNMREIAGGFQIPNDHQLDPMKLAQIQEIPKFTHPSLNNPYDSAMFEMNPEFVGDINNINSKLRTPEFQPEIITNFDKNWDYMQDENGEWFTKRKGANNWKNMKDNLSASNYQTAVNRLTGNTSNSTGNTSNSTGNTGNSTAKRYAEMLDGSPNNIKWHSKVAPYANSWRPNRDNSVNQLEMGITNNNSTKNAENFTDKNNSFNPITAAGAVGMGVNNTIANILGGPVDLINSGLSLVGAGSDQPVFGSEFNKKHLLGWSGTDYQSLPEEYQNYGLAGEYGSAAAASFAHPASSRALGAKVSNQVVQIPKIGQAVQIGSNQFVNAAGKMYDSAGKYLGNASKDIVNKTKEFFKIGNKGNIYDDVLQSAPVKSRNVGNPYDNFFQSAANKGAKYRDVNTGRFTNTIPQPKDTRGTLQKYLQDTNFSKSFKDGLKNLYDKGKQLTKQEYNRLKPSEKNAYDQIIQQSLNPVNKQYGGNYLPNNYLNNSHSLWFNR